MIDIIKLITTWIVCLGIRLIPFRPANVEPILASAMPVSKRYGSIVSVLFAVSGMALYDLLTGTVGVWSLVTIATYGLLTLAASLYFKNREASRTRFVAFSIVSTLMYDGITGLAMGPILFHQTFLQALIGQVPFTVSHLIGNALLAALVSPLLLSWLGAKDSLFVLSPNKNPLKA